MRIVINAYQYSPSITGTDRMAHNFLVELQMLDTENTYYVICSSEQYIQPAIVSSNFKILEPKHIVKHLLVRRIVNKLWRTVLPLLILCLRADVYYSFHNMRLPRIRVAKKMIASNLDLIPLVLDEYKDLTKGQQAEILRTAKKADAFVSISDFSKSELHELLGVENEKIHVIHLATDQSLSLVASSKADLPENFIFTIGGSEPRKDVLTVAKAFSKLPESLQKKFPLLIVGGPWHGRSLGPLQLSPHIKLLGYINDELLADMYRGATAFVFASKYEGFGFTILEAMSFSTPVITTTDTSLSEVAGDATLSFKTGDADDLARQLQTLLTDPALCKKLSSAGKERSKKFSWAVSAQKLHKLLIR